MIPICIEVPWDSEAIEKLVDAAIASGQTKVKMSRMKIGSYNGFSKEQRLLADRKIKVAIELGLIPKAFQCSVCGTMDGRIDYHNEDYGQPLRAAAICVKCHMALHNRGRSPGYPESWARRVKRYGNGSKWFERLTTPNVGT